MTSKFDYYEVVKVSSKRPELSEINGFDGAILGFAEDDDGIFWYAVDILTTGECWDVMENELISTGKMMSREDFYTGESISVSVTQDGEGKLKQ
ncbi:immunity protein 31 (plasmid) [Photobacterium sp. GJ3]|uniref:Imm31 family immunity protein n=1 Tax=Photobacterium sp. GJ3 TaxID=2829502 RepID=UPI001B8C9DB3|nr:Imm31 family immunity protein [Photobacterium sp. GJ3]QUJ69551.1 immunity protein 31 [Photobacterium sp. GJ3]